MLLPIIGQLARAMVEHATPVGIDTVARTNESSSKSGPKPQWLPALGGGADVADCRGRD